MRHKEGLISTQHKREFERDIENENIILRTRENDEK